MRNTKGARRRRKAGFTLVELLVTMVLIGIISLATFAILDSSLVTFRKQKDHISAIQLKNILAETVRNQVAKSTKIALTDDFMHGPKIKIKVKDPTQPNGEIEREIDEINLRPDGDPSDSRSYLRDNKVTDYGFIYSYNGKVYVVERNVDGRVNYDKNTNMPTAYAPVGDVEMYGNPVPLIDDRIYDKYQVDMTFKPIRADEDEQYFTLQIVIDVTTKPTAKEPSKFITRSVETIALDNVKYGKRGILYRNNPTVEWLPEHTAKNGTFKYCYFAKMK